METFTRARCGVGMARIGDSCVPNTLPFARSSSAVGVDNVSKQIVLYGGLADVNPLNTWTYDGTTWTLESPAMQPLTVYAASAAFEPNLNSVVLFGGGDGGVDQNRTWSWTGSNWVRVISLPFTPAREGAGMAYDKASVESSFRRTKPRGAGRRHLGALALGRRSKSRRAPRRNSSRRRRCSRSNARRFGFRDARPRPDRYPKG